ncbi:MAG: Holliday junction branch migration protein RuvA [Bdellovibrionales bacterium]
MIAYLQGSLLDIQDDSVIMNVRGVGYELCVSSQTAEALSTSEAQTQLWVYTHVREDALSLFGFLSKTEKELFLSLIKVNGIGPKVAMKILSGAPLGVIIKMIDAGDVSGLSKLPKVGKKTAEQIVLSLKGKLVFVDASVQMQVSSARSDIVSALVNLGFKNNDVEKVVSQMDVGIEFEEGIKRGLAGLAGSI